MSLKHYQRVLVIAAHPDDEVLGCGGTIARLVRAGCAVDVAILGEGITSRYQQRSAADQASLKKLRADSRAAADLLGVRELLLYELPDNRFDTVPLLEIVKIIEDMIAQIRPQAIFTQHGGDLNVDHAQTFRATLTATRPINDMPVRAVYAYEVPSSSEWAFQRFSPRFVPNIFSDITGTLENKIAAMQAYVSEVRPFPHPRSPEALRAIAQRWGSVVGCGAAEAFELIREVD